MSINSSVQKSSAYVISQCQQRYEREAAERTELLDPAITISHQTGAGVHEISEPLSSLLQEAGPRPGIPWAIFDQELIERALVEHRWPKALAEKIIEEKRFFIDEVIDDMFGLRPPSWVLVPQVVETTLRLAMAGHVILIGHGATVATANLPNVFHVRVTASLETRIGRVQTSQGLTPDAAAAFVNKEDRGRDRYVKAHFHARLDDELLYDLVINTDRISIEDAVRIIAEGVRRFIGTRPGAQSH